MFAFADPARLTGVLEEAGFRDVRVEPVELWMADFASGAEYFAFMQEVAGPVTALFEQLPPDVRPRIADEIARKIQGPDGRARIPGVTWVASGVK